LAYAVEGIFNIKFKSNIFAMRFVYVIMSGMGYSV